MNELFTKNNTNITSTNNSQTKVKNKNFLEIFSNLESNKNRHLSENQRNLTKFNSQKKIKKKDSLSKYKGQNDSKNNEFLVLLKDNNIFKKYSNIIPKTSKVNKNKNKSNSHYLSKLQLKIEINNMNNSKKVNTNYKKISTSKKYKKNISEHDLVNNILSSFTSYIPKSTNINPNFSSKKKCSYEKNKKTKSSENIYKDNLTNPNKAKNSKNMGRTRQTSGKLLRSSSGYTYSNNNFAQTNSFFGGNNSNYLGYISTWGNSPNLTNCNFGNLMKASNQKDSNNNRNNKSNKGPIIGKIIKNYKNNDLNCIFNMNLIHPISPLNNIQDYFKNMYKIEYNNDYRVSKNKNKKDNCNNVKRHKRREIKTKYTDDITQSKNTMTKTSESKTKKENYSIDNLKYFNDSPEEIHYYIISSIQNAKNMVSNLSQK